MADSIVIIEEGTEKEPHTLMMKELYENLNKMKIQDPSLNIMVLSTVKDSTGKTLGASFLIGDTKPLVQEFTDCMVRNEGFQRIWMGVWNKLQHHIKARSK